MRFMDKRRLVQEGPPSSEEASDEEEPAMVPSASSAWTTRLVKTIPWPPRQRLRFYCLGVPLLLAFVSLCLDQDKVGRFHAISVSTPSFAESESSSTPCPLEPCNLSIVFLGDSVSRFMYYSLAYFLRHDNTWIDPDSFPHLVSPADFFGGKQQHESVWVPFFNASTLALAPYEVCDCFREAGRIGMVPCKNTVCENRYFWDPIRNNSLVYFQAFGNQIPSRGHFFDPVATLLRRRPSSTLSRRNETPWIDHHPFNWTYSWSDMIRFQVAPLRPSVFILNAGHWYHNFQKDKPGFVQEVLSAINETMLKDYDPTDHQQQQYKQQTQVIWKTTTPAKGGRYHTAAVDRMMCRKLAALQNDTIGSKSCLNLTDRLLGTPPNYYIDDVHFREPVYRVMNEQLLLDTLHVRIQLSAARPAADSRNGTNDNATTGYYYQRFNTPVRWIPPEAYLH